MLIQKSFETEQTATRADEPDLLAIRKYALREVKAEEVWTGAMKLCHDRYDRSHERFPKAYLDRFAATLPGKSVLGGHNYSSLPIGRFYGAEVLPDSEGHHLKVSYYLSAASDLVPQIEMGVLKDVSIGFQAGKRVCDLCEKTWAADGCEHWPGLEYDGKRCTLTYCESEAHKAEAMEGSFVWMACQPGAEATAKAAEDWRTGVLTPETFQRFYRLGGIGLTLPFPPTAPPPPKERGMFDTIEKAVAEIERLKALPLAAERETELQKAIADKEPLAKDGAAFRQHLKDEILRMAGAIDAADKTTAKTTMYTTLLAKMDQPSAESLMDVKQGIEADFNAKFAGGSGDPNAGERLDDDGKPKPAGLLRRFATGGHW